MGPHNTHGNPSKGDTLQSKLLTATTYIAAELERTPQYGVNITLTKHHEDKASCVSRGYKAPASKEILCINPVTSSYPTSKNRGLQTSTASAPLQTIANQGQSPANQATRSSTQPAASGPPINPRLQ
jgi:hypothetical protein|uniref:Uncharacterized protein n=1 Tax=Populus trichocarpa TaxID=3694 RepID=B9P7N1_POPTR